MELDLVEHLSHFLSALTGVTGWVVGYSGGRDSHVLLHALSTLVSLPLRAIHINHGISPAAPAWATHCQQVCESLKIDYQTFFIQVEKGSNLEERAREARYATFREHLKLGECLLIAHHQQDQAETVLLQLFRGAGPKGLSGMPLVKPFGEGHLARPFLKVSSSVLAHYAEKQGLKWIEDESNQDLRFHRNYLRYKILPLLLEKWPGLEGTLSRSAELCAEQESVWATVLEDKIGMGPLPIELLMDKSPAFQAIILRRWLEYQNVRLLSEARLHTLQHQITVAGQDAQVSIAGDGYQIKRFQSKLYVVPDSPSLKELRLLWSGEEALLLPGLGTLKRVSQKGQGLKKQARELLEIRFRQGGERFHPANRSGSHPLKKLFQEWEVPPWERDRIPLIWQGEELVAVVGFGIASGYEASPEETGVIFEWV